MTADDLFTIQYRQRKILWGKQLNFINRVLNNIDVCTINKQQVPILYTLESSILKLLGVV